MRDTRPEPQDKPYGIEGIPLSPSVEFKTPENGLPFTPNMPVRREITSFYEAKDDLSQKQWTLFILALIKFKAMPVDDKFSYFQVAGIHGYPQTSWDGAEDPPKDPSDPSKIKPGEDPFGGYCKHNSINFPTWHRPYMLLFEKRLWVNMGLVIDSWKLDAATAAKWEEAKDQWRLPYWDWALKQKYTQNFALPEVFTLDKVQIYPPTGDSNPDNPLWGFVNPEKDSKGDPLPFGQMPAGKEKWSIKNNESDKDNIMPWGECSGVSRYGILRTANGDYTGLKGENRFGAANTALAASDFYNPFKDEKEKRDGEHDPEYDIWVKPGLLSDAISRMFSSEYSDTWGSFATTKWFNEERWQEEVSTGFLSLEYIHNNVHNLTGGSNFKNPSTKEDEGVGHMSDVPVAAFDPIFYMHHCNIDRLLAMWQVLNWNTWFNGVEKPQPPGHKNQNLPDPTENDVLEPFHIISGKKDVWTSKMTRDWTKLHYQYDTLEPQSSAIENGTLNEVQYRKDIKKSIRATYPSTVGYVRQILRLWEEKKTREIFGPNIEGNSWNDYIINVIYDRYALFGRSYSIEFWLDGDEKDPESAFKDPVNRIGRVYSLGGLAPATNDSEGCANCGSQRDMKVLSRAQIPITIPLLSRALRDDYLKLNDIRRQHVEEYLKKYLRWRFIEHGETRDATAFKDTKIMVLRGHGMILPTDEKEDEVPQKYSGYEILYLPTEGKAGGVGKKDDKFGEDVRKNYRTLNEAPTQEQVVKH